MTVVMIEKARSLESLVHIYIPSAFCGEVGMSGNFRIKDNSMQCPVL